MFDKHFEEYKGVIFFTTIPEGEDARRELYEVIKLEDFKKIINKFNSRITQLIKQREQWRLMAYKNHFCLGEESWQPICEECVKGEKEVTGARA